jgi:hypothetical protein
LRPGVVLGDYLTEIGFQFFGSYNRTSGKSGTEKGHVPGVATGPLSALRRSSPVHALVVFRCYYLVAQDIVSFQRRAAWTRPIVQETITWRALTKQRGQQSKHKEEKPINPNTLQRSSK